MIARAASFEADETAVAVGGRLDPGRGGARRFTGISTDTRDELEGRLFIALQGDSFDAHDFLARAVEGGAAGLLVSERGFRRAGGRSTVGDEVSVVVVQDSLRGLGDLARHHRRRVGTPVLALTGSNGKTTTKEMLAAVLGVEKVVLATQGNLNNLIGLPLTLLGLESSHDICVAEMGMNALGEIERMVEIAEPRVGLVTNVGPAHIGELGSIENIARAKGEMYRGLVPTDGVAVVNLDDARVVEQADASGVEHRRTFGTGAQADVRLAKLETVEGGQALVVEVDGEPRTIRLALHGRHNAMNALAAVAAATALPELGASATAIERGLAALVPLAGRGATRELGPYTVIDDSYNANAASALASIEAARHFAGARRWVAAIGEMKELGDFSEQAHREIGEALHRAGAAAVAAFGPLAASVAAPLGPHGRHEASDFDALMAWLLGQLRPGDVILVKGSRSSRMERVVAAIEERV